MKTGRRFIFLLPMMLIACSAANAQQITASDLLFFRLSTTTNQMAYEQSGGDMKAISPLIAEAAASSSDPLKAYRAYTHALVLLSRTEWTPDSELATALDFTINAKAFAVGDYLQARATFVFDSPAAAEGP